MPDDLFGIDRLTVYDGGNLAVGAARVETDTAAVRMAAGFSGLLVRLREVCRVCDDDLKRPLVHVLHKTDVELALPARAVLVLHTLCNRVVAAQIYAPAADAPQKQLDHTLGIAVICLGKFRAAQLHLADGYKAVFAFNGDFERAVCVRLIRTGPDAEGNKSRIQRGQVLDLILNA